MTVRTVPSHRASRVQRSRVVASRKKNNNNPQKIMITGFIISHGLRDISRYFNHGLNNFDG